MTGLYFSGTGNTRYCTELLVRALDPAARCAAIETEEAARALGRDDTFVVAYPIYFSNLPKLVRDFLEQHAGEFRGKRVFLLATMGLFSGDGAGCGARVLRAAGAEIIGGLHVKMPDCIGDEKALKKTPEQNRALVARARQKLMAAAERIQRGDAPQEGLGLGAHAAGLLGQRLWFYGKTRHYSDKLKIDDARCVGCGSCVSQCPMQNLSLRAGKAVAGRRCTMCYRCISNCPRQAVTLLGKQVYEQCRIERYLPETGPKE